MSDGVAVALITGGLTAVVGVAGNWFTWKATGRQASAAIETADKQAKVELAKSEAETARLREGHAENDRQQRFKVYQDFLDATLNISQIAHGARPYDAEAHMSAFGTLIRTRNAVEIFGVPEVVRAAHALWAVFDKLNERATELKEIEPDVNERWKTAMAENSDEMGKRYSALAGAMRKDVALRHQPNGSE